MPPRVIIGDLVARLLAAKESELDAQRAVTEALRDLIDGWRPRFPTHLGWHWTPARGDSKQHRIDVYEAIDSPAAAHALWMAGFTVVVFHDHPAHVQPTCACTRRVAGEDFQ